MFKKDGNGGYNIKKSTLSMIMMLIALISCIITVVAYTVTIKADVEYLKTAVDKVTVDHPAYQEATNQKLSQHETAIVVNQEKILAMHEDIIEIKSDVKELLKK